MNKKQLFIALLTTIIFFLSSCDKSQVTFTKMQNGTTVYDQSFRLDWTAVEDADGYLVEISQRDDFQQILFSLKVNDPNIELGTTGADVILEHGEYYVRVKPDFGRFGGENWSKPLQIQFDPVELRLVYPASNITLSRGQPLEIECFFNGEAEGELRIQLAADNSFEDLILDEHMEETGYVRITIPQLDTGFYKARAVFYPDNSDIEISSSRYLINVTDPLLFTFRKSPHFYDEDNPLIAQSLSMEGNDNFSLEIPDFYLTDTRQYNNGWLLLGKNREIFGGEDTGAQTRLIKVSPDGTMKELPFTTPEGFVQRSLEIDGDIINLLGRDGSSSESFPNVFMRLNAQGIILKSFSWDTPDFGFENGDAHEGLPGSSVVWEHVSVKSVTPVSGGFIMAGVHEKDYEDRETKNVFFTRIDNNGAVRNTWTLSEERFLSVNEYLGQKDQHLLFLGSRRSDEWGDREPVLFLVDPATGEWKIIELLANTFWNEGQAVFDKKQNRILLGWGQYVYTYDLFVNEEILEPVDIRQIDLDGQITVDGETIEKEFTNYYVTGMELDSHDGLVIRGSLTGYDYLSMRWTIYCNNKMDIDWQAHSHGNGNLVLIEYPLEMLTYGPDWMPWRTNTLGEFDSDIDRDFALIYQPEGTRMGVINCWDSMDEIYGPAFVVIPPEYTFERGVIGPYYIYNVEGVYCGTSSTYRLFTVVTSPDWVFNNGLKVGDSLGKVKSLYDNSPEAEVSNYNWMMQEIIPSGYDYVQGYYLDEWEGAAVFFYVENNNITAIGFEVYGQ